MNEPSLTVHIYLLKLYGHVTLCFALLYSVYGYHSGSPGGSHVDMVYVNVPVFWVFFFTKFGIAICGFLSEMKAPKMTFNRVYFEQIIVTTTQYLEKNWVLFY